MYVCMYVWLHLLNIKYNLDKSSNLLLFIVHSERNRTFLFIDFSI